MSRGTDWPGWGISLRPEAALRARYATLAGGYPDQKTGFVFATAKAPAGSEIGIDGVTISVSSSAAKGPLYFAANSDPNPSLTATSTFSSALFAGLVPGEVTVTFGPGSVTCVTQGIGWPSPIANSIRVPVAAGFETRVVMQCHK